MWRKFNLLLCGFSYSVQINTFKATFEYQDFQIPVILYFNLLSLLFHLSIVYTELRANF